MARVLKERKIEIPHEVFVERLSIGDRIFGDHRPAARRRPDHVSPRCSWIWAIRDRHRVVPTFLAVLEMRGSSWSGCTNPSAIPRSTSRGPRPCSPRPRKEPRLTTGGEKQPDLPISDPPAAAVEPEGTPVGDDQELRRPRRRAAAAQEKKEAARFVTSPSGPCRCGSDVLRGGEAARFRALEETTQFPGTSCKRAHRAAATYAPGSGGDGPVDLGGGGSFRTEPQSAPTSGRMLQVKPAPLTRARWRRCRFIAYGRPDHAPEMEDLRGVDCGAVTKAPARAQN